MKKTIIEGPLRSDFYQIIMNYHMISDSEHKVCDCYDYLTMRVLCFKGVSAHWIRMILSIASFAKFSSIKLIFLHFSLTWFWKSSQIHATSHTKVQLGQGHYLVFYENNSISSFSQFPNSLFQPNSNTCLYLCRSKIKIMIHWVVQAIV